MTAQALIASAGEAGRFSNDWARRLRSWFLSLPAGIGRATLKASVRLCFGVSPQKSGVFSAGNGPAMRSAIIGVCYGSEPDRMAALVRASTRVTHTDPKAEWGAFAVALAAHLSSQLPETLTPTPFLEQLRHHLNEPEAREFLDLMQSMVESVAQREPTQTFAETKGWDRGVRGYVYSTVAVALHAAFSHPTDYRCAVLSVIRCGGDTDTTGAIVGGIVGAGTGPHAIPEEWISGIWEWPKSGKWIESLGQQLFQVVQTGRGQTPLSAPFYAQLLRNAFFLGIILTHGFRRVIPIGFNHR
jgi:ADP-ribosylglycohydrolase